MKSLQPKAVHLEDYRPPAFLVQQVDLDFQLDDHATLVTARLLLARNPLHEDRRAPLILVGEALNLLDIQMDGRPLAVTQYQLTGDSLIIEQAPDLCELQTRVAIVPSANTRLEGLYCSGELLCTQCEPEGFRRITYYLDRPDVMAPFRVRLEADQQRYPVLLANGNAGGRGPCGQGRHFACWEDPFPKPSYLFALVAGRLDLLSGEHQTPSGRCVQLRIYTDPGQAELCRHALESLKRAMRWDEEAYGRECDLDGYMIVAVRSFNMGAMENKGLNIFNAKYILASPETATDEDYHSIESVVAHEYFHNWTGNRITCRDWFQLSLKEGLTVFRDQEFSADMHSRPVQRIQDVRSLRMVQFPEDAGPMAHAVRPDSYIEINNFYTATVYDKGAEVVRMQRQLLGSEGFRRAMDLYFARHDGQAVTTDDFVRCMEDASGRDLREFRHWYTEAGTPHLDIQDAYDPAARRYRLSVRQSCPPTPGQSQKPTFHLPLAVGMLGPDGEAMQVCLAGRTEAPRDTWLLEVRNTEEHFVFEAVEQRPIPSLLREFSAPVRLTYGYRPRDLGVLMAHDPEGWARWEAAQRLAEGAIFSLLGRQDPEFMRVYLDSFAQALRTPITDPALLAEVLNLPALAYLEQQMVVVDIAALHQARNRLRALVAERLEASLQKHYQQWQQSGPYQADAAAMGARRLRNLLLGYLAARDHGAVELAWTQFQNADNMTDRMAALSVLAETEDARGEQALRDFYQAWRGHELVIDKWFSVQATADRPATLERVQTLLEHRDFNLHQPNRVRALLGAFTHNLPHFHHPSGGGYLLLAQQVRMLDVINPQVAARMVRAFVHWRRYEPVRRHLMERQLRALQAQEGLSPDLYEVVTKTLQEPQAQP